MSSSFVSISSIPCSSHKTLAFGEMKTFWAFSLEDYPPMKTPNLFLGGSNRNKPERTVSSKCCLLVEHVPIIVSEIGIRVQSS